jgi:hypothetical protein
MNNFDERYQSLVSPAEPIQKTHVGFSIGMVTALVYALFGAALARAPHGPTSGPFSWASQFGLSRNGRWNW